MKETLTIDISSSIEGVNDSKVVLDLEDGVMVKIHVDSDSTVLESDSSASELITLFIEAAT